MSWDFYREAGYMQVAPKQVNSSAAGGSKVVVWTPTTSLRVVVTTLGISTNLGGTIEFYFGGNNQQKLASYFIAGSTTIWPNIDGWESTAIDAPFYTVFSAGTANGWQVTAEGFELE